jgi:hypothetical protein
MLRRCSGMHIELENPIVQPKLERLVRRGRREYIMIGKKADGGPVEIRLGAASFRMESR